MATEPDHSLHHYHLMLDLLEAYEQKKFDLRHLIEHLEQLLSVQEDVSPDWRHAFYRSWGVLEDAATNPNPEDNPMVNPAVAKLKELVRAQLGDES